MAHHLAAAEPRDGRAGTQGSPRRRPSPPQRRRRFRTLVVLILVVGAAATLVSAVVRRTGGAIPHAEGDAPLLPASGVWLGVQLVPGSTGSARQTLAALETRVGRRFDVVYQQLGWDAPLEQVPALEAERQARIPLLGWQPRRADGSIVPWRSIASGREDARLTAMAITLRAAPRRVYLAFANQPEAEVGGGYGTAGDYAPAYRHVHDLFAKLGVTNVAWVWGVTSGSKWASLRTRLYPGDAYVDWLAVDVGDARCGRGSAGGSFADITEPFHRWATTRHPGKPAMVTGYGGIPEPAAARPAAARLAADLSVVRARRPEIKAVVYSAARGGDGCGRGMATSFVPPTPLSATGQATGGGNVTTASARACLARDRTKVTRVDGTLPTYRIGSVGDGRTYDLRQATIVGYPATNRYVLLFGKQGPGDATCVLGGRVIGQQSRGFSWQAMKQDLDGDGLNFRSQGGIVDGTRIDNVEDGISTIGGDPAGIAISNVYLTYIRDDCIENDAIVALRVQDSLLDGCFNGVSERPGRNVSPPPPPSGEALTLDGVLMRLRPMPYDRTRALCAHNAADGLGNSGFFKWSPYANRLVIRNTVLLAERGSINCGTSMNFPGDGVYQNVTLVWLGGGGYPGRLPPSGVTVTTDRHIWDQARARWLARHGYPTTGDPAASP